jgi:hypothetical protein
MKVMTVAAVLCALASTGCAVMLGYTIRFQPAPVAIDKMCPKVEVEAAFDGVTLYRVQTCEGATVWLQAPDLLSMGVE